MYNLGSGRRERKAYMTSQLTSMTEGLMGASSTRDGRTTSQLGQRIHAGVAEAAMPSDRRSCSHQSMRKRWRRWGGGSGKTKGVERPDAVASGEKLSRGKILHKQARRIKLNGTRIVNSELTNRKKIMNDVGSDKDIVQAKGTRMDRITY